MRTFREGNIFFGLHSRIRGKYVFVPLQNYQCPPNHATLAPGLVGMLNYLCLSNPNIEYAVLYRNLC